MNSAGSLIGAPYGIVQIAVTVPTSAPYSRRTSRASPALRKCAFDIGNAGARGAKVARPIIYDPNSDACAVASRSIVVTILVHGKTAAPIPKFPASSNLTQSMVDR